MQKVMVLQDFQFFRQKRVENRFLFRKKKNVYDALAFSFLPYFGQKRIHLCGLIDKQTIECDTKENHARFVRLPT